MAYLHFKNHALCQSKQKFISVNNNETDNNFIGLGSSFIGSRTIKLGKFNDIKIVFIVIYENCLNNFDTATLAKSFVEYKLYKLMNL